MQPRQPRRSHQQWHTLIEKFKHSGLTQQQFCEAEHLTLATFRKWFYKHTASNQGTDEMSPSFKRQEPKPASTGFGPVTISPSPHLPGGACLELPGNVRLHTQSIPPVEYLKTLVELFGNGH